MSSVWDTLHLLYRGPLSSCNYDCHYCPFAKHGSSPEELEADRAGLARFTDWVIETQRERQIAILFTPWGEGLVRGWYRDAMTRLSHAPNVVKVAIQTNLSAPLDWLDAVDRDHLGLWVTYHPTEIAYERFLSRCRDLHRRAIRFSVGIVGLTENLEIAEALRADLPREVYVWVNAFKDRGPRYYRAEEIERLTRIDPFFPINAVDHESLGRACHAGSRALSIDGDGNARRCHFVPQILGNIYRDPVDKLVTRSPCPAKTCGCHIGYVHLESLELYDVFGDGLVERIPQGADRDRGNRVDEPAPRSGTQSV
jgi:MoaA/NifB/PqqE/SkfB family radical SAM enzyme